jgi:hypothetical protein
VREDKHLKEYKLLQSRIEKLVKTNGFNFTFKYLKECLRLVTLYLAGTPQTSKGLKSIGVRVNQYGLPVIIPSPLRRELSLLDGSRVTTRCILTLISIFRVFPTKVKPDLGSITNPFTGITRTIDNIEVHARRFCKGYRLSFGPIKGFISESAGPVAKKSTWGAPIDAIALLGYPKVAFRVISILLAQRAWPYAISLLSLWLINGPLYLFMCKLGVKEWLPIGRLSVVYDQAGKARIVAMANWWVQLVLLPLHKSIFSILESKDTDGTFDQDKPLRMMMENPNMGHQFSCFDLSAATDRLPVDLQVQILNSLGINGLAWKDLVVGYPYAFKGQGVRYTVGQPMGAYSSWAMLALTHHLIVKVAASQVGIKNFNSYCLLGDDIVINHDAVAERYLVLMESLGVAINLSKSVISKDLAEFAKRLVSPLGEISPIGAGNILLVSRRTNLIGALLAELYNKSVVTDSDVVIELIDSFPRKSELNFLVLWTYFGSCRHLYSARLTSTFMEVWNTYGGSQLINFSFGYHLFSVLRSTLYDMVTVEAIQKAEEEERRFWSTFYKLSVVKGLSNGFFESLGLFFSPGLYLYGLALLRATEDAKIRADQFDRGRFSPDQPEVLLDFADFSGLSVKWTKRQAKQYGQFVTKLTNNLENFTQQSSFWD